ncbi:MAG TPA: YkgJ family cysteine cluster protein, partial [Oscillatoriaceae cyanobacterium]
QDVPAEAEAIPAVGEAIRAFRAALPDADNLGRTGDSRDLYVLVDRLTAAVREAYPASLCRAGCSRCCETSTAVFDVSRAEWDRIAQHLDTAWTAEEREALAARFEREQRPQLSAYRLLGLVGFFEPLMDAYFARNPYRCPFLVDGRCSIYAARPLVCRMYGYFQIRRRWYTPASIYACRDQTRTLSAQTPLHLPATNTVAVRSRRLTGGRARLLAFWIAGWLKRRCDKSA